jgi:hypothetical protein
MIVWLMDLILTLLVKHFIAYIRNFELNMKVSSYRRMVGVLETGEAIHDWLPIQKK